MGDEKYGDKVTNKKYHKSKQMLCAKELVFENLPTPLDYLNNKKFCITPTFNILDFNV